MDYEQIIAFQNEQTLSCFEMIQSVIAYAPKELFEGESKKPLVDYIMNNSYVRDFVGSLTSLKIYRLAIWLANRVKRVVEGVYTDCEGCSYNQIEWIVDGYNIDHPTIKFLKLAGLCE